MSFPTQFSHSRKATKRLVYTQLVEVTLNHIWWRINKGMPISLTHREVLCRVIGSILQARASGSLRYVIAAELLRTGWPDEYMLPKAGRNRLWVAISSLRKLGLDQLLERGDKGYLLRDDVEVRYL